MNTLTYPQKLLVAHLRELMQGGRRPAGRALRVPLGRSWTREGLDFIVACVPTPCDLSLRLTLSPAFGPPGRGADESDLASCAVALAVGEGEALGGQARGWFREDGGGEWQSLDRLHLTGGGLDRVRLRDAGPKSSGVGRIAVADESIIAPEEFERRSRTIGALGEDAFRRLSQLRVGFVGMGRLGGDMLFRLAETSGLRQAVLVDPDRVELHNTGESLFFDEASVGQWKVHAVENWLAIHEPQVEVAALAKSVSHGSAIDALKRCDLIISAADHAGARVAAAAVAAAYGRVLIDLGTLVGREGALAADVRLVLPERCLLCFGGVSGEAEGRPVLASPDAETASARSRDWRSERAGSLDSLNDLAACAARRLLERLVSGRQGDSVWLQFDETEEFPLRVNQPQPPPERDCFCSIAGWADAGIPRVLEVLERRAKYGA
jgi:molybdopterin/thiamine biosynthesis adenylyltransferase